MSEVKPELAYSYDWETYHPDLDTAIDEAMNDCHNQRTVTLLEGKTVRKKASDYLDQNYAGKIIDRLADNAYDDVGAYSRDWLMGKNTVSLEHDLTVAIKNTIDEWATRTGNHPKFFSVVDSKEIIVDTESREILQGE